LVLPSFLGRPVDVLSGSWRLAPLYQQENLLFVGEASSLDQIAARCRSHKTRKPTYLEANGNDLEAFALFLLKT